MSLHTFLQNTKPSLAFLLAAWLFSTGARSTCTETVYTWERETGLEPATACLEGRVSTDKVSISYRHRILNSLVLINENNLTSCFLQCTNHCIPVGYYR